MPSLSTIAWETLLEPRSKVIPKSSVLVDDDAEENKKKKKTPNHIYISPALYITPVPTPIPDTFSSDDPPSPSPYVVNHKRRGGGIGRRRAETPKVELRDGESDSKSNGEGDEFGGEVVDDNNAKEEEVWDGDFSDPRCDSASVASSNEVDEVAKQGVECRSYVSNQGEFFDADDDFSSDGSISSYGPRIELELHSTRLSLLEEIERRKTAECAVTQMYTQWQRLGNLLSQTGLTFPTPPNSNNMQFEIDLLEQFCQELLVARFVAEAIGRGQARAEAELAAEVIIESKDQEISRLRDRLQYYEAANHEMAQRNQEIREVTRQRQRKESQRWWVWGCVGMSVAIGASVIAFLYLPKTSEHHILPSSSDASDATHISTVE